MVTETLKSIEEKMKKSVSILQEDLGTIRAGHATPALVEHIKAEYGGVPMPLHQIAGISAPEARLLIIQPWDKSSIRSIEKAILKSDLGLNPSNDGNIIRLNIPPLSEERRQELIRVVKKKVEERRIIVRNMRRDAMDDMRKLEKNKEISQDEMKRAQGQLQKITDAFIANAEKIGQDKEVELMEV